MTPEPGRFRSAAQHYLRGHPAYAPALIQRVAQLCELTISHRVLDLGCGPGQLALAFASLVGQVVAVDPEPEMLRIAREAAARAGLPIEFREGSSRNLGPDFCAFRLAVIGRAFHWMDREDTLRRLNAIIEPGGCVALFSDDHPPVPDNSWSEAFDQLIDRYAGDDAVRTSRREAGWLRYEAVLLDSPFPYLERISVIERRRTPVEDIVERALSLSSVSHARIGAKADDMAREVSEMTAPLAKDGLVAEVVESKALIARREPAAAASAP